MVPEKGRKIVVVVVVVIRDLSLVILQPGEAIGAVCMADITCWMPALRDTTR